MAFYLLCITVAKLLDVLLLLMLIRAVLSWFMQPGDGNKFFEFLDTVTEFVVAPVRSFMERFEFVQRIPLDISFFLAFIFVQLLSTFFAGISTLFL